MDMNDEETQAYVVDLTERCEKASLTPEQTAQVVGFGRDGFWGGEKSAHTVIDFFTWANDKALGDWLEKYEAERPRTEPSGLVTA